jgi:hypothetical protein
MSREEYLEALKTTRLHGYDVEGSLVCNRSVVTWRTKGDDVEFLAIIF